jgi:beta propeller repeat protein
MGDPSVTENTDIYMYKTSTARTTHITKSTRAFSSFIYGDKIIYTDWRNSPPETSEVRDIFLYDLKSKMKNKSTVRF